MYAYISFYYLLDSVSSLSLLENQRQTKNADKERRGTKLQLDSDVSFFICVLPSREPLSKKENAHSLQL